jgi:hypothetical protein
MSGDSKVKSIALRMDDVGASSKHFEVYSKFPLGLGNIIFLKYLPGFRAWGKYDEMSGKEWYLLYELLAKYNACLTVGVTASWVEYSGELTPINKKFPAEVKAIRDGISSGLLNLASHGLTHCLLADNQFRPKLFKGNRSEHREFWDHLPYETHHKHISESKRILEETFEQKIEVLVPPGNVFSDKTVKAANANGIKYINCNTQSNKDHFGCQIISNEHVFAFHDRELKLYGMQWLRRVLLDMGEKTTYKFVYEIE